MLLPTGALVRRLSSGLMCVEDLPPWVRMVDADNPSEGNLISFGPFRLYPAERLLKKGEQTLPLGGRALNLLMALVERAPEIISRRELIARIWPDTTVEEANLRVHITILRKALGDGSDGARYVVNVPGRGYCFVAPVIHHKGTRPSAGITVRRPLANLPARSTRMVGREDTIRRLSAQLLMWRFVSIVGPGGMGKTTVAISVAHALFEDFEGALFFVDLAALTDPELVPTAVASALGLMVQTRDPLASLRTFNDGKKILVILDNCEHVIEVAASLAERIVTEAPQAHVLTTSREALRVEGEQVHLLYALDYPAEDAGLTAAEALKYPAVQLFVERAAAAGYDAALSDADAPSVARICQRLDGIALAIEVAASRAGSFGIQGTEELLDNRFKLLWQGRRTARPRHQTLNAMLDWSYGLLSEHEQLVLCRLSVFVGGFTAEAGCSVAAEAESDEAIAAEAIAGLLAKSLISTTSANGSTYYRLLETTRIFAAAKISGLGEENRIARRHAMFFSGFLRHDEVVQSRFGKFDLSAYSAHIGNVRAALEWAFSEDGDPTIGIALAASAASLFVGLSLLNECKRWCERALAAMDGTGRNTRREMVLQGALALSSMYTADDSGQIRPALERALTLAETFGDQLRRMELLAGLYLFLVRKGDLRGARTVAEQGAAIAREISDPASLVCAEWMLGNSHYLEGNQAKAQFHCERGLAMTVDLVGFNANFFGCDFRVSTLAILARAMYLRGFSDQALATAQKAIDEAASRDDPVPMGVSRIYASSVFLLTGDLQRARSVTEQLIAHARRYSLEGFRALGLARKGELAIADDEAESGVALLRSTLKVISEYHHLFVTTFTATLADGLRKTGKFEEALFTIDDAIAGAISSGKKVELSELLRIKSFVFAAQDDRESAIGCLTEAIEVARAQSALAFELRSSIDLARLLCEAGQRDQAHHNLALVYDRFTEGFQTADLKVARGLLENLQPRF
jgi:predicted ATPase/DNA-binding winged helix-turn-helix (wHTH) protein